MKKPLVSIGVPVYNNAKHLRQTLSSLSGQSYANLEIIVSDDASSDGTADIAEGFADIDRRIRVYRQHKRLGTPGNFNFTLKKAVGKYFLWAAGDDFRDKNCIATFVSLLEGNPECVLAVSRMEIFNARTSVTVSLPRSVYYSPDRAIRLLLTRPEAVALFVLGLYRRNVLINAGGYHRDARPVFQGASDLLTSLKVLLNGSLAYTDKTTLHKRDSGYYLTKNDILKSGNLPPAFVKRAVRYLLFPVMFFFDLYHTISSISASHLSYRQKSILNALALRLYIIHHIRFIETVSRGLLTYAVGLLRNKSNGRIM